MHVVRLLGPVAKVGPAASENQSLREQTPTWPSFPLEPLVGGGDATGGTRGKVDRTAMTLQSSGSCLLGTANCPSLTAQGLGGAAFLTLGGAGTCHLPTFLGCVPS